MLHICPQCGAVNPEHAEVCSFCETPLRADDRCPECAATFPEHESSCSFSEEVVRQEGICPNCGAANPSHPLHCGFCDSPLRLRQEAVAEPTTGHEEPQPQPVGVASEEPAWRAEVSRKLEEYRARRGPSPPVDEQKPLPFIAEVGAEEEKPPAALQPAAPRPRRQERVDISVLQSELNFTRGTDDPLRYDNGLVPVAELSHRFRAGVLDAIFLTASFAGFLGLFHALGGHSELTRVNAAVYGAAFLLFYIEYFVLFTVFGGITPGMQACGLKVVSFDGTSPAFRQLLWRGFGYIVAGGSALLGFFWTLWDEDHLSWQDRISQTYITPAATADESAGQSPSEGALPGKSWGDSRRIG